MPRARAFEVRVIVRKAPSASQTRAQEQRAGASAETTPLENRHPSTHADTRTDAVEEHEGVDSLQPIHLCPEMARPNLDPLDACSQSRAQCLYLHGTA